MAEQNHRQMANFIWEICNLLRNVYKRNEYRKVILPLTVLRRFDCILSPTKKNVLESYELLKHESEGIINKKLTQITGVNFYNLSKLNFNDLTADPNYLSINMFKYINAFSLNVRKIFECFEFVSQINRMNEKNILFEVINRFASDKLDLSPSKIDHMNMGYIFEELIRIGAEQSNEEAGEHFTPREVIKLMVNILLSTESDLKEKRIVKRVYDPACGTGGMLSEAESYIRKLNPDANLFLYGQDVNDESWAVCCADMLIKNKEAGYIFPGDSFTHDGFPREEFDYMLANPPFGVEWKNQQKTIKDEHEKLGYNGRFGAGYPRINDGSLLFLQHMISKMQAPERDGSRIAIVFNGSPLSTGDAESGESNIRRWIIEKDWLEAIIALPDQLFYNTGISTYIWIVTNRKQNERKGKIQLIDAREFYIKMSKNLGNKRNQIGDGEDNRPNQIEEITNIYKNFIHNETVTRNMNGVLTEVIISKVFNNEDFGYYRITIERPLRMNFSANAERIARINHVNAFQKIAESMKKNKIERQKEIELGRNRQEEIKSLLQTLKEVTKQKVFSDRRVFLKELKKIDNISNMRLSLTELKAILEALGEKDEKADICLDGKGNPEPDADLRDTENVPLSEDIDVYFEREVLHHVPDAWIDKSKTKIGYEIPLNRHFYRYEPPRPLEKIEAEIKTLESEIEELFSVVTSNGVSK